MPPKAVSRCRPRALCRTFAAAHHSFCRSAKDFEEAFNMAQMQLQDAERQIADVRLPARLRRCRPGQACQIAARAAALGSRPRHGQHGLNSHALSDTRQLARRRCIAFCVPPLPKSPSEPPSRVHTHCAQHGRRRAACPRAVAGIERAAQARGRARAVRGDERASSTKHTCSARMGPLGYPAVGGR